MEFAYEELSSATSKRLLKALPGTREEQPQIELWEEPDNTACYRCLSYTWGDPSPTFSVLVNGRTMQIGENLYEFLVVAAQCFPGETFWIDAICINQQDVDEKAVQVQRMGSIFERSLEVVAWLGNHEGIEALFKWTSKPRNKVVDKVLRSIPVEKVPWHLRNHLKTLSEHPYWTRAWITQELMMARSLRLVSGQTIITLEELSRCRDEKSVDLKFRANIVDRFTSMSNLMYFLNTRNEGPWQRPVPFWDILIQRGTRAQCFNPRDRIYSLLGVTGQESSFKVDYSEETVDTFCRVAQHFRAWNDHFYIGNLARALELTYNMFLQVFESRHDTLQIPIPMRPSVVSRNLKELVRAASVLQRTGHCSYGSFDFSSAKIRNYSATDILLCSYEQSSADENGLRTSRSASDKNKLHLTVHPLGSGSKSRFTMTAHFGWGDNFVCPEDSELWSAINGHEAKVLVWEDVQRVVETLKDRSNENWKSDPHFVLKVSHHFLLEHFKQSSWVRKT